MKNIIYTCFLVLVTLSSCKQNELIDSKEGISLPQVENLSLQQTLDPKKVKVTWVNPSSVSSDIQQPLSVFIEVSEIMSVTKAITVYSVTLPNAPSEFVYEIPNVTKKYNLTVKVMGMRKTADPNYSNRIYSLGQTVSIN